MRIAVFFMDSYFQINILPSGYFLITVFMPGFQLSFQCQSRISDVRHDLLLSDSVVVYVGK